jgi:hypothetical protein
MAVTIFSRVIEACETRSDRAAEKWTPAIIMKKPAIALITLITRFGTDRRIAAFGSAAARLLRAYAMQVEVLRRLRTGGQQVVRVEHVHVNDGGQAAVGNVQQQDTQVEERRTT